MGDELIQNVTTLVKENRRMHALIQTMEFRLSRCECTEMVNEEVPVQKEEPVVVVVVDAGRG